MKEGYIKIKQDTRPVKKDKFKITAKIICKLLILFCTAMFVTVFMCMEADIVNIYKGFFGLIMFLIIALCSGLIHESI